MARKTSEAVSLECTHLGLTSESTPQTYDLTLSARVKRESIEGPAGASLHSSILDHVSDRLTAAANRFMSEDEKAREYARLQSIAGELTKKAKEARAEAEKQSKIANDALTLSYDTSASFAKVDAAIAAGETATRHAERYEQLLADAQTKMDELRHHVKTGQRAAIGEEFHRIRAEARQELQTLLQSALAVLCKDPMHAVILSQVVGAYCGDGFLNGFVKL